MYDRKVRELERIAQRNGKRVLIPATNVIIIKDAEDMREVVERYEKESGLRSVSWNHGNAEIRV